MIDLLRLRAWPEAASSRVSSTEARPDEADFQALVETHYRRVYNLVYRIVRSEADAADLTQETFLRVYRALPRLRAEAAQDAWIRRIATNLCLDFLRRRRAAPPISSLDAPLFEGTDNAFVLDIADPSGEPDRLLTARERREAIHRAIESLPDDYRLVIVLHHMEEMRVEEIAESLHVPAGTIKSRLSRARRALYRKLAPHFDPDCVSVR